MTPDYWLFSPGESGTSTYTITVTKDAGTEEAWVEGVVKVTNGGDVATENLAIKVVLLNGYPPPKDYLNEVSVDVSGNPVLDPRETGIYPYRVDIPITGGTYSQPKAGGEYKVTANVTITNHSGWLGTPFGPNPSDTCKFPNTPTKINDTINVDDTNGGSWAFSDSGSVTYDKTFTCADVGENLNTATIRETGQSDDALVTVECRAVPKSELSGSKWYDRDKDAYWDGDEPGIQGWLITLYKQVDSGWDWVAETYTNADGGYSFPDLEDGTYKVEEGAVSGGWVRTSPEGGFWVVTVEGQDVSDLDFGNVCYCTTTGGKTIGFWSNKNGAAVLNKNSGWTNLLNYSYNLRNKDGSDFVATTTAKYSQWLLSAEATNMSYMLSAQLSATILNVNYMGQNGDAYGVIWKGEWKSINDLIAIADLLLKNNGVILAGNPLRPEANMLVKILDSLNNNTPGNVIPKDPCPVPLWP